MHPVAAVLQGPESYSVTLNSRVLARSRRGAGSLRS
jgi:hypothetical protein